MSSQYPVRVARNRVRSKIRCTAWFDSTQRQCRPVGYSERARPKHAQISQQTWDKCHSFSRLFSKKEWTRKRGYQKGWHRTCSSRDPVIAFSSHLSLKFKKWFVVLTFRSSLFSSETSRDSTEHTCLSCVKPAEPKFHTSVLQKARPAVVAKRWTAQSSALSPSRWPALWAYPFVSLIVLDRTFFDSGFEATQTGFLIGLTVVKTFEY